MQNEKNEKDKKKKSKSSNKCGKKSLVKYRLLCLTPSIHCCLTSTLSSRAGRHVGEFYPTAIFIPVRFRPLGKIPQGLRYGNKIRPPALSLPINQRNYPFASQIISHHALPLQSQHAHLSKTQNSSHSQKQAAADPAPRQNQNHKAHTAHKPSNQKSSASVEEEGKEDGEENWICEKEGNGRGRGGGDEGCSRL